MIIVINSQGGLVAQQDEELHQGSSRFNTINLIAPFGTNVVFRANFELPDGTIKPSLEGALMRPSIETPFGVNTWKLHLDFPITQYSGQVKMQIRGLIGDVVACTTTVKFYVEKGVPYQSEYVPETTYDDIMAFIADLQGILVDKVNINHNKFEVDASVTASTVGVRYVYEDGEYKSKTLPQEYQAGVTYYKIATTGIVGNNDNGLYLQMSDGTQTTKVEILKDKVVINGKTVIVVDDLIAENIAYDNTESGLEAENVQDAIDEVEARVDTAETTIEDHGTRLTTAEGNITNLQGRMNTAESNITNLQGRMTTAESDIDTLEATKEDKANKTNTISNNAIQYASAKAVFDYAENKANKVSSITISSTDIQYPSAKAVYDGLVLKEDKSNKVIAITQNSTNTEYPSAKAVYELVVGYSGELKIEFVEELPEANSETWFTNSHTFYFKSVEGEEGNVYEEYVCRKVSENVYAWEMIGSAQVDLSNYYTKDETDALLSKKSASYTFATKNIFELWLARNYERLDGRTINDLKIGDIALIEQEGVTDYWCKSITKDELGNMSIEDNFNEFGFDLSGYQRKMQFEEMPTPSVEYYGKTVQYVGETNVYTNSFFYKCVVDTETETSYSATTSGAYTTIESFDDTASELDNLPDGETTFKYDILTDDWKNDGVVVDLEDYGITIGSSASANTVQYKSGGGELSISNINNSALMTFLEHVNSFSPLVPIQGRHTFKAIYPITYLYTTINGVYKRLKLSGIWSNHEASFEWTDAATGTKYYSDRCWRGDKFSKTDSNVYADYDKDVSVGEVEDYEYSPSEHPDIGPSTVFIAMEIQDDAEFADIDVAGPWCGSRRYAATFDDETENDYFILVVGENPADGDEVIITKSRVDGYTWKAVQVQEGGGLPIRRLGDE